MKVENENTAITLSEATKAMLQDRIIIILTIDACCKFLFLHKFYLKKKQQSREPECIVLSHLHSECKHG